MGRSSADKRTLATGRYGREFAFRATEAAHRLRPATSDVRPPELLARNQLFTTRGRLTKMENNPRASLQAVLTSERSAVEV